MAVKVHTSGSRDTVAKAEEAVLPIRHNQNKISAGGGGVKSAHSRNPGQSQQQQQQHHHHHHGGHSAAASSPSYADVEREAERAAEDEASAAAATIEGADSDGTPAGASDATVKLLRQLRHRATELESQLATAGREKERLQLELGEATGGWTNLPPLIMGLIALCKAVQNSKLQPTRVVLGYLVPII
eukprot:gene26119-18496_t